MLCAEMAAVQMECPSEALGLYRDWRMTGERETRRDEKKDVGKMQYGDCALELELFV